MLLRFDRVTKRFGDQVAVRDIQLDIYQGEFFSLLGPSGCGKTTLLRMIAGFEAPDEGSVLLDGQDLTALPAHRRPVNTVFQHYALFPHLDVFENVAFGLRRQGVEERELRSRVELSLEQVRLGEFIRRQPGQLSGGQKQRVALARALVLRPRLLLLDEPLGALDHQLRLQMQVELKQIQRAAGITFVFVTHDQPEALTMSDRIAVLSRGRIEQVGTGFEVYERPATEFVARFLGASNLVPAVVRSGPAGATQVALEGGPALAVSAEGFAADDLVKVMVRPEWLTLLRHEPTREGWTGWPVRVTDRIYQGSVTRWTVEGLGPSALEVTGTPALAGEAAEVLDDVRPGEKAWLCWRVEATVVLRRSEA